MGRHLTLTQVSMWRCYVYLPDVGPAASADIRNHRSGVKDDGFCRTKTSQTHLCASGVDNSRRIDVGLSLAKQPNIDRTSSTIGSINRRISLINHYVGPCTCSVLQGAGSCSATSDQMDPPLALVVCMLCPTTVYSAFCYYRPEKRYLYKRIDEY
jgi:hypothetical protein